VKYLQLALAICGFAAHLPADTINTYNLTSAEDANSTGLNPDGPWTFLRGTTVLPYNSNLSGNTCFDASPGITSDWASGNVNVAGNCVPAFFVASGTGPTGAGAPAPDFIAGDVLVHSQNNGTNLAQGQGFVTWTAPAAGTITVSGDIWYAHSAVQRSNDFILALAGSTLTSGTVAYNSGFTRISPDAFNGGGTFAVTAGEVLSLEIVASSGQAFGSADGIDLTVVETVPSSGVPEPGSILLLASAAGILTFLRRR
jgi:hypothetical protein